MLPRMATLGPGLTPEGARDPRTQAPKPLPYAGQTAPR